jgi:hypothetical protein
LERAFLLFYLADLDCLTTRGSSASSFAREQAMFKASKTAIQLFGRIGLAVMASSLVLATVPAHADTNFVRIPTQYIAALGDPQASSGTDAETWGLWAIDPGPRGVYLADYADLVANAGVAPVGWKLDPTAWWLEEYGRLMEAPTFPLPAGKYVVTGGRDVASVLIVEEPDAKGKQAWSLADGASVYDVTHLGCRAALYTQKETGKACTPDKAPISVFPMTPFEVMPAVEGCSKQDYQVLIVVGMVVEG